MNNILCANVLKNSLKGIKRAILARLPFLWGFAPNPRVYGDITTKNGYIGNREATIYGGSFSVTEVSLTSCTPAELVSFSFRRTKIGLFSELLQVVTIFF